MTNVRGPPPPQQSHIIPYGHLLRSSKNVAIPMICVHGLKHSPGNYVRNCFGLSLSSPARVTAHVGPMTSIWALSPARKPDEMCVGGSAHVHV